MILVYGTVLTRPLFFFFLSLSLSLFFCLYLSVLCVLLACMSVCLCVCVALSLWATLSAPDLVSHSLSNSISLHFPLLFLRLATALERRLGYGVLASVRLSTDQDSGRSKVRTYMFTHTESKLLWSVVVTWKAWIERMDLNYEIEMECTFLTFDFSINDLLRHTSQINFVIYWNVFCSF